MSSQFLFLSSKHLSRICEFLETRFEAFRIEFPNVLEKGYENTTTVFLTESVLKKTTLEKAKTAFLVKENIRLILTGLLNAPLKDDLLNAVIGPGHLYVRYLENGRKVEEILLEVYDGKQTTLQRGIDEGEVSDTLISLTDKPLTKPLSPIDILEPTLLIKRPADELYEELSRDVLFYISQSLDRVKWHEYDICIYDSNDHYDIQHEKLKIVLGDLDAGIVIGEGWSEDHPFVMLTVLVYKVKIYSYLSGHQIKEILLALEYDSRRMRVCDLDLYEKGKKVPWTDKGLKSRKKDRISLAAYCKEKLYEQLSQDAVNRLTELEVWDP